MAYNDLHDDAARLFDRLLTQHPQALNNEVPLPPSIYIRILYMNI